MSEHMRKHHTKELHGHIIKMHYRNHAYAIPWDVAEKYRIKTAKADHDSVLADDVFAALDKKFSQAGALLKGLRYRENLTQSEFAKKINVSQSDLSKMENGKRPIGKAIAKRIETKFGMDYRNFLE